MLYDSAWKISKAGERRVQCCSCSKGEGQVASALEFIRVRIVSVFPNYWVCVTYGRGDDSELVPYSLLER